MWVGLDVLDKDSIEARIETDGIESAVQEVLAHLNELDSAERSGQIRALEAACGVEFGDNPKAWESWLGVLQTSGLTGFGSLDQHPRISLTPDDVVLAEIIEECSDETTEEMPHVPVEEVDDGAIEVEGQRPQQLAAGDHDGPGPRHRRLKGLQVAQQHPGPREKEQCAHRHGGRGSPTHPCQLAPLAELP